LNLTLPQGPQGPAGQDGADGADGQDAPQNTVVSPDESVTRLYLDSYSPPDGQQPGDMILTVASAATTPASLDGLSLWLDASQTAPVDQPDVLPDLSGNGNDLVWLDTTDAATLSEMRGLQAWTLSGTSRYSSKIGRASCRERGKIRG